ncbi:DUF3236 domain-containing protein [Methanothermobacter tenebrarum]|uniref:DUF3236 domain-containing protein n=1 Tax=Methanothermobacter tenebrarum TaxID=680118 RepID=A0A328PIK8_9EURY|nr:DUF3236 domain-containing protein [Methanothermobacter tenebrarum]MBC7101211.1 DUF3236 domain-containing protein [Methanobacteriales archaeon]MBC7117473.1 DUF3236 domain-containing protein [Methanobacteriaceae archaeon]NPV65154.1 DUF3236 domain-containing protein [Methanobacteriaceae archaeon]RAO79526.1 DUF3236 domain-containing protein [Methanothermobacter tenebrarum]
MLKEHIKKAYNESAEGKRKGDKKIEVEKIKEYILSAENIIIPNWDKKKLESINKVLKKFGLPQAKGLKIHTNAADLTRMPTITKALMAVDTTDSDLVIARGRLGIPGSGSMLVIMDCKGRILSAAISPPHIIHGKSLEEAVEEELKTALKRLGL